MAKLMFENHLNNVFALIKNHKPLFGNSIPEIEIPPGWIDIVKDFLISFEDLTKTSESTKLYAATINQIKTKSGALYINVILKDQSNNLMQIKLNELVETAKNKSLIHCRGCGKPGKLMELNFGKYFSTQVRCEKHLKNFDIFKNFPAPSLKTTFDDRMEILFSS